MLLCCLLVFACMIIDAAMLSVRLILIPLRAHQQCTSDSVRPLQGRLERLPRKGVLIAFIACCSLFGLHVDVSVFMFCAAHVSCFLLLGYTC